MVQPTAYEQYLLELVNRSRSNPLSEANSLGIDLNKGLNANTISGSAKQPLAFNLLLNDSARSHSQWMLDRDVFKHEGEGGSSPGDRMRNAGYQFTGSWTWSENIGTTGTTGTLDPNSATLSVHQGLFNSPGHRVNMLNNSFREVGLAALTGDYKGYNSLMVTQNFAKSGSNVFLTGVAFDDSVVNDDFYSVGEGLAEIEVTAIRQSDNSKYTTTTMNAGGYQMALTAGTYDVSFSRNNRAMGSSSQINISSENVKLDLNTENLTSLPTQYIGEVGKIDNLNHLNQTIQLDRTYTNPVVFALPVSYNGGDPAIARITDLQSDRFSVYLQEPDYKDKKHTKESLSYLVLEAGSWQLADGTIIEVGTIDTNSTTASTWSKLDFESEFDATPSIFSQVQTNNGKSFVRTRQKSLSSDGFELAMEEEEALKLSGHAMETVGWLAIESGSGNWDGLSYQAGSTGNNIDHSWDTVNFGQSFNSSPNLFASLASFNGGDAAGLRYRSLGASRVQLKVEEDQSLDRETTHASEIANFLAIAGSGNLSATAYDPMLSF